jgi:hypothetical protein
MKQNIRCKISLSLAVLVFLSIAAISSAHVLGYSSVDNMEIRYGGSTKYTTAQSHSIDTWNDLGEVNIAPDNIWTYEDVTYSDYDDSADTRSGVWTPSLGSDTIEFNEYLMDDYTGDQQKYVALHELGHALGLAHTTVPNVMVQGEYSYTELGSHDEESYYSLYP